MTRAVWDASALLVLLHREPGWERLAPELESAVLSSVNLAEVASRLVDAGGPPAEVRKVLEDLDLEIHDLTADLAFSTAELRAATRARGLSLGDRACLALGQALGLPVLTADRAWAELEVGVEIRAVR